jgi:hypothetical protein
MSDEIIRELWRVKEEIAREFNYDVAALVADLRRRQGESGKEVVDLSRRTAEPRASDTIEPPR